MYTILLVDDNKNIREFCQRELEQEGYRVLLAGNGKEALDVLRHNLPDIVILDVRMPVMDGLEAIGRIIKQKGNIPVIFYTAYKEELYFDSRSSFAKECIEKSEDLAELKLAVARVLAKRRKNLIMNVTGYINKYIKKRSKSFLIASGFVGVILVGVIDYLTGPEISLSIFYLLPISLVTWFTGRWRGFSISIFGAIIWLVVELAVNRSYSQPIIPYWNATVRLGFFLIVTSTLSAFENALEREKELARTDPLTRVANGRAFWELADVEINRVRRYKHPFTVAYVDIDNFKTVNDRFGHSTGDVLLYSVAETMKNNIRVIDIVARLGGDEFVILFPETGPEPADVVIRKLQKILLDVVQKNGWPVTFSIGVVTFISSPSTVDEIIKMSDDLMYSVKNSGKNNIKHEILDKTATVAK